MRTWLIAAICLACFIPAVVVADSTEVRGTLCFRQDGAEIDFTSETCTLQTFTKEVVPAAESRDFVWRIPGSLVLGTLAKGERRLEVHPNFAASLIISSSDFNYWPAETHFDITSGDRAHVWRFLLDRREIDHLRTLKLPEGEYQLVVSAQHHRSLVRKIVVDRHHDFRIGRLAMARLPIISGTVIDATTGTGLANVEITLPSQKLLAVSDGTGRFRGEVLDDWPEYVRATYPGRGTKVAKLLKTEADTSLPDIMMRRGGSLTVAVSPATHVTVDLARAEGESRHVVVTREIGDSGEVMVDDLDPGDYAILIKGTEPLQQHCSFVRIEAGAQNRAAVTLRPTRLHVNVRGHDQNVVTGATLEFVNTASKWRGIVADSSQSGHFDLGLWQTGNFTVFVTLPQRGGYVTHATLDGDDDINWQLDLPSHSVKGRIADGRTGEAVPDAHVFLQITTPTGATTVWTNSSQYGEFEFPFVPSGHAVLSALAAGFVEARDAFDLPEGDGNSIRPLLLDRAHIVKLSVADQAGAPIIDAIVVDSTGDARSPLRTDETGTVAVPLREDEDKLVYIIPREGSFGTVTLASCEDHAAAVIGPALSTIRIFATAEPDGTPVPDAGFIIRFNGTIVPPRVVGVLAAEQGMPLRTGPDGTMVWSRMPSGVYEFFPIFNVAEANRVLHGFDTPKAQLSAKLGDNLVSLTFRQKVGQK